MGGGEGAGLADHQDVLKCFPLAPDHADAMAGRSVLTSLPFFGEIPGAKIDIIYNGSETVLDGYTTQARFKSDSATVIAAPIRGLTAHHL